MPDDDEEYDDDAPLDTPLHTYDEHITYDPDAGSSTTTTDDEPYTIPL